MEHRAVIGHHHGIAIGRHGTLLKGAEVGREQRQAVGAAAQEIALQQHLGNAGRALGRQPGGGQQGGGEVLQFHGVVARGHGWVPFPVADHATPMQAEKRPY